MLLHLNGEVLGRDSLGSTKISEILYFACLYNLPRTFQVAYPKCYVMIDIGKYQLFFKSSIEAKLNCALT